MLMGGKEVKFLCISIGVPFSFLNVINLRRDTLPKTPGCCCVAWTHKSPNMWDFLA